MTKEKKYNLSLILLCLLFFVIYSFTIFSVWIPQGEHLIFNWPDANANYFFAKLFAQTNSLSFFEPLNLLSDNLLHTRSINVWEGNLVPITFLPGVILFALPFKVLGSIGILFLTPALAASTAYIIYRLAYYIFKDLDLAFLVGFLLLSMAPWIFFANVVMLTTVMFIFLVSLGCLLIAKSYVHKSNLWVILGTLSLSLALVVRPSEIVWVALLWLFIIYSNKERLNYKRCFCVMLIVLTVFFVFLSFNKLTYGDYFRLGYFNLQSGGASTELTSNLNLFNFLFIPFGFDFILILKNIYRYFIEIIPIHFLLALVGLILLFYRSLGYARDDRVAKIWKEYLKITPFIFLLIFVYYGSWNLADPLVLQLNRISSSYVRYFMPLYILSLPLTAYALREIFYKIPKLKFLHYIFIILIILVSFKIAFYSANDGLLQNKQILNNYYQQYQAVEQIVPTDAVIITDRTDKLFFPKYKVIAPQGDLELWPRIANISHLAPIYYYTAKTDSEIEIDQAVANELNLNLIDLGQIWYNFHLYQVVSN